MKTGKTLFAQLMDFLPWTTFSRLVARHGGDCYAKSFACTEQFRVMALPLDSRVLSFFSLIQRPAARAAASMRNT